jgi:predicted membrane protein
MKSGKAMFFGVLFLLLGLSLLLKAFFGIDIPLIRTLFAIALIYIGVKMLFGPSTFRHDFKWSDNETAVFQNRDFKSDSSGRHYSVVFGKSTIDLTDIPTTNQTEDIFIEVNTVFGESTVYLRRATPVRIRAHAVFGEARTPDENSVAFGNLKFESATPSSTEEAPSKSQVRVNIQGSVVFGSMRFVYKD